MKNLNQIVTRIVARCLFKSLVAGSIWIFIASAMANEKSSSTLQKLLEEEISIAYGGAKVQITEPVRWVRPETKKDLAAFNVGQPGQIRVRILGDDGRGRMHFLVERSQNGSHLHVSAEGWVSFSARALAKFAVVRVRPGDLLKESMFATRSVELSTGAAHDFRGVLVQEQTDLSNLEAIQTVLEGYPLTTVAVRRVPDVRKGDQVQVHVISSGIVLTTSGIAGEPGNLNSKIRVMTGKTKRELSGLLVSASTVEVNL